MSLPTSATNPFPPSTTLIPTSPALNALTWMLGVWQADFAFGGSIDAVARHLIATQESVLGEVSARQKNSDYQRVYMLSIELVGRGLLYPCAPSAPPLYKPVRPWYEITPPEETPTP